MNELLLYPDEFLYKLSKPVEIINLDIINIVDYMKDIMKIHNGIGLAANQIGSEYRICVIGIGTPTVMINPKIIRYSKSKKIYEEGCLSIPDIKVQVIRPEFIEVDYFNLDGNKISIEFSGIFSRIVQHEVDHLDGILMIDRISEIKRNQIKNKLNKLIEL